MRRNNLQDFGRTPLAITANIREPATACTANSQSVAHHRGSSLGFRFGDVIVITPHGVEYHGAKDRVCVHCEADQNVTRVWTGQVRDVSNVGGQYGQAPVFSADPSESIRHSWVPIGLQKFETCPDWGAKYSLVENGELPLSQGAELLVFRFESSPDPVPLQSRSDSNRQVHPPCATM